VVTVFRNTHTQASSRGGLRKEEGELRDCEPWSYLPQPWPLVSFLHKRRERQNHL